MVLQANEKLKYEVYFDLIVYVIKSSNKQLCNYIRIKLEFILLNLIRPIL